MGRIVGVACDNCGTLDVEVSEGEFKYSEDNFPRNGWLSINQWQEADNMRYAMAEGVEIHICSASCLKEFSDKYLSSTQKTPDMEKYGHTHE